MEFLKSWKNSGINRNWSLTHSPTSLGVWMCTLTIHDNDIPIYYMQTTTQFVGTKFNNIEFAANMTISMFIHDVGAGDFPFIGYRNTPGPLPRKNRKRSRNRRRGNNKNSSTKTIDNCWGYRLDDFISPLRENETEDCGLDDVKIIKRSPIAEAAFIKELDRDLEEYFRRGKRRCCHQ